MAKAKGLGMSAFFSSRPQAPLSPDKLPVPKVRTTVSLTPEDAERLDLLRMRLRQREGRGLTYGDVLGVAIRKLARDEGLTPNAA